MLSRKDKKYLEFARSIAEDITPENIRNARISSILVSKNKILGVGYNHKKSHPFAARFQKNEHAIYFHSEVHAIHNALKTHTEEELMNMKTVLYVYRARFDHKMNHVTGLAKPCEGCMGAINFFCIDTVIYSLDGDEDFPFQYAVLERN